jgi:hypothetical protein
MYLNLLNIQCFHLTLYKEMNRTNSLIILASLTLGLFLVYNTAPMIDVSAFGDGSGSVAQDYLQEQDYTLPPPLPDYPLASSFSPPIQENEDIYGDYSDQYESGYYEDHYGKPYLIK